MPFKKGQSGNPNGRPKRGDTMVEQLEKAINEVEKAKKRKLFNHFVRQAFEDNAVLIALMRKIIPDMKHIEGDMNLTAKGELMQIAVQVMQDHKNGEKT